MQPSDSVLVVDDEMLIALDFSQIIEEMGLRVCGVAETAKEAVELTFAYRPALVLMDVRLKGTEDGVDAALKIHALQGPPIIFITGSREQSTLERIRRDHPRDILIKPISPAHLQAAVRKVLS